jgi:hypothetical protein
MLLPLALYADTKSGRNRRGLANSQQPTASNQPESAVGLDG